MAARAKAGGLRELMPQHRRDPSRYDHAMATPRWPWWHQPSGPDDYRIRELLRAVWDLHALYGQSTWLWRGQPNLSCDLTAAVHSRISDGGIPDGGINDRVKECTRDLADAAREAHLDIHEGTRLPDLALLAMLQHHGAATPLLDVSLDPLVGLYMAVVSPYSDDDSKDGVLFAIRRPDKTEPAFSSRRFEHVYDDLSADNDNPSANNTVLYAAPDVSERLRIQRGIFLLARATRRFRTSLPLTIEEPNNLKQLKNAWIYRLMDARGKQGLPAVTSDVAVFRVTAKFKPALQTWLEDRSGLTPDFVLPTAWHQPHLDRFCAAHGRLVPWALT